MFNSDDGREAVRALIEVSGLGISLAAGVVLFTATGWWLDHKLGTAPVLMALGCLLGGGLGLYKVVRDVQRLGAAKDHEKDG
jgi:F0F1-type ATP synthase assembly protein I